MTACTCAGPAPGYPQHEFYCGDYDDEDGEARLVLIDRLGEAFGLEWGDDDDADTA